MQREGRNRVAEIFRRADGKQTVLSPVLSHQPQAGARKCEFPKSVITAKHLIPAVHGVHRLLSPRAVLVVVVHTKLQRAHRNGIDPVGQFIAEGNRNRFQRIRAREQGQKSDFQIRFRNQFQIARPEPPEMVGILRLPGTDGYPRAEIPIANAGSHPTVRNMLAPRDVQDLRSRRTHRKRQISDLLMPEVKQPTVALAANQLTGNAGQDRQLSDRSFRFRCRKIERPACRKSVQLAILPTVLEVCPIEKAES